MVVNIFPKWLTLLVNLDLYFAMTHSQISISRITFWLSAKFHNILKIVEYFLHYEYNQPRFISTLLGFFSSYYIYLRHVYMFGNYSKYKQKTLLGNKQRRTADSIIVRNDSLWSNI